ASGPARSSAAARASVARARAGQARLDRRLCVPRERPLASGGVPRRPAPLERRRGARARARARGGGDARARDARPRPRRARDAPRLARARDRGRACLARARRRRRRACTTPCAGPNERDERGAAERRRMIRALGFLAALVLALAGVDAWLAAR